MTPLSPIAQAAVIYGGYGFILGIIVCFTWYKVKQIEYEDDSKPGSIYKSGGINV